MYVVIFDNFDGSTVISSLSRREQLRVTAIHKPTKERIEDLLPRYELGSGQAEANSPSLLTFRRAFRNETSSLSFISYVNENR